MKQTLTTAMSSGSFNDILHSLAAVSTTSLATSSSSSSSLYVSSSYTSVVLRSAVPTSSPSSRPTGITCKAGFYHNENHPSCTICPKGTFSAEGATSCHPCMKGSFSNTEGTPNSCPRCPLDSYQPSEGAFSCNPCPFPTTTLLEGQIACTNYSLKTPTYGFYIVLSVAVFVYLCCIALTGFTSLPLIAFSFFPALDVISDILYFVQTGFYNMGLFLTCVGFLLAPSWLFVRILIENKALMPSFLIPRPEFLTNGTLLWLSLSKDFSPLYNNERIWLSLREHDTLLKVAYFLALWLLCITSQVFCLLLFCIMYVLYISVHAPLWITWFCFGAFLLQIKMLSVGSVWNIYFRVWLGNNSLESRALVDTTLMNQALFAEFLTETLPQLALQGLNNNFTSTWSTTGIFSTALSVFMSVNGLYRYGYYTLYKRVTFADIPLLVSFGPIVLKLDTDTHRPKHDLDKDSDDELDQIELETKPLPLVTDDDTIADVTKKLSDIMSNMVYNNQRIDGLLRASSLHSLLWNIIPDFSAMPLMKVAIIETMATVVEKHGVDLEECSKVELLRLLQDKQFATSNPILKECNNWLVQKIIEGLCDELKACNLDDQKEKKKSKIKKNSEYAMNNDDRREPSTSRLGLLSYLGINYNSSNVTNTTNFTNDTNNDVNINVSSLVVDMIDTTGTSNDKIELSNESSDDFDNIDQFWSAPR